MSVLRWLSFLAFLAAVLKPSPSAAQLAHPDLALVFDEFVPLSADTHYDTHNLVVGKPVKTLNLSMTSSGIPETGDMHLTGSEILLDVSNAQVLDSRNTSSELLISLEFNDALPIGTYPATKVVFGFEPFYAHVTTVGTASGTFFDGEPFLVVINAGFIPEPSTCLLFVAGLPLLVDRRRRRRA
jgi:hypothetical protein